MPRDMNIYDPSSTSGGPGAAPSASNASAAPEKPSAVRFGLSLQLLGLTVAVVMVAEVLIFLPWMANYRCTWLRDRLTTAYIAALAAEEMPGGAVPRQIWEEMKRTALVQTVALHRGNMHRLVLPGPPGLAIDATFDMRLMENGGPERAAATAVAAFFTGIGDALGVFLPREERMIRVVGPLPGGRTYSDVIDIVLPEAPLKQAMIRHALTIQGISLAVSSITAMFIYVALSGLLVRPLLRLARNMLHFSQNLEDTSRVIVPSKRTDEIGVVERELERMQRQLAQHLREKNRLAQIGLAVSKINHDLRNMLANTQLISERLGAVPDPTVQTFAPKLIASLDRAINFCNSTLKFGRADEAPPRRELLLLRPLVEEVGEALGLPHEGSIGWVLDMDARLRADADREHLFRILTNLVRNAIQALEGRAGGKAGEIRVSAWREGRRVSIEVRDNGPGLPPRARDNLFRAFQGSTNRGGSGLGLAIVAELAAAHGGSVRFVDIPEGAAFLVEIPDRPVR